MLRLPGLPARVHPALSLLHRPSRNSASLCPDPLWGQWGLGFPRTEERRQQTQRELGVELLSQSNGWGVRESCGVQISSALPVITHPLGFCRDLGGAGGERTVYPAPPPHPETSKPSGQASLEASSLASCTLGGYKSLKQPRVGAERGGLGSAEVLDLEPLLSRLRYLRCLFNVLVLPERNVCRACAGQSCQSVTPSTGFLSPPEDPGANASGPT